MTNLSMLKIRFASARIRSRHIRYESLCSAVVCARSSIVPLQVFTNGRSERVLAIIGRKNKTNYIDMHDTSRLRPYRRAKNRF